MKNILSRGNARIRNNKGFTLVEVLVAILVGLIVMGMSIAILGSTNSTALRVIAKSEAQLNTRDSISKIFSELADADSLEVCRIADTQANQNILSTGTLGRPGSTFAADNCKETSLTGFVIAVAAPNRLCYYKAPHHDAGAAISSDPPDVVCIARGGSVVSPHYGLPPIPTTYTAAHIGLSTCLSGGYGTDQDLVYKYTCKGSSGESINWPVSVDAPTDGAVIADLGSTSVTSDAERSDLFEYRSDGGIINSDLSNILGVRVMFNIRYANGNGTKKSTYLFKQDVVLRKSLAATREGYDD